MGQITLKINKPLQGKAVGEFVKLEVDTDGVILDSYWRNRLRDAEVDGCVEIVKSQEGRTGKARKEAE